MNPQSSAAFPSRTEEFPPHRPLSGRPGEDLVHYLKEYARQKPDVAALWCFGIGFVLGWKLKPW